MPLIDPTRTLLLVIDLQIRLMPAIAASADVLANTGRLTAAARLLDVPVLVTEQNAGGLGTTVPELAPEPGRAFPKMSFGAARAPGFLDRLPRGRDLVVTGCEAHICVLQTVVGLLEAGCRVYVVGDAVGSRRAENREAALGRMAAHGAEIVTTEMVVFEWLGTARHPRFREVVKLIK
ncbi:MULTISPECIES: isochorismatase family protein [Methylobacterium]|jgi:nicotinamidase-related amidase|uniref:Isochorismatase family protein n=1 Tax=Methylobacterium longum TaxID=767694 RepID=A0ABT8AQG8_9HYPH|nr:MULTISPECIES: isochorismatase family protein [Methylobacterium]MCJ2102051.1 isochorismatase family protein [Methylobacterium sp. E-046]MDN3572074.1 isochorismatase family protein [Methylobacterium longum]GJE11055.1 Vibriobactin-specific isochorismatase [Methylobacterium longum]